MISVVILTKNEESLIKTCLESVKWVDEIIIVDNGSTDKTLDIAKKYTDKIVTMDTNDFSQRRNRGMKEAKGDWVLYIDSDERVLKNLKEEITSIISSEDSKSAYALSRINIIFGEKVTYGPYQHDWMIRLFKKADFETWIGKVHEYGKFKGELGYAKNSLIHLTHRNLDHIVFKSLNWSHIDAKLRLDAGHPPMAGWRFVRIVLSEMVQQGIIRKGFFNGAIGSMDALLQVFSMFMTYVRLWELQQPQTRDEVYKEVDEKLIKDGFNYS